MNSSEKKLNKQISKYYVEHACQISSTGQVAKELSLETSRVSELKGGRRQLTVEQAEIIKRIYGLPSASQGHWVECELLSKDFHKSFIDNSLAIHFIKLIELLNTDKFVDSLIRGVSVNWSSIPGYEDPWTLQRESREHLIPSNNKIMKDHKLKLLDKLFDRKDFQEWCESAIFLMSQTDINTNTQFNDNIFHEKDILSAIVDSGVVHWDMPSSDFKTLPMISDEVEHGFRLSYRNETFSRFMEKLIILHRLNLLVGSNTYANIFEGQNSLLSQQLKINKNNSPIKEFVVVGKCVWDPDKLFRLQVPIIMNSVVGWSSGEDYSFSYERDIMPNKHRFITIRLFYTETYNYFVELNLFDDEYGAICNRCLMIQIEDRQDVFGELAGIFNYFKLEDNFTMRSVKRAVAENGGYVPSAIYID